MQVSTKPQLSKMMEPAKSSNEPPQVSQAPRGPGLKISDPRSKQPRPEVSFKIKLQQIASKIYAAKNLNEILVTLIDDIAELFKSERVTIYMLDGENRELVSRFKSGKEISEIRIAIKPTSIAGYAAYRQKTVNVKNVNDEKELRSIDSQLKHDKRWDDKTGFVTKQVLALPIFFQKYLMGALQFMNKLDGTPYTPIDERASAELGRIIGIGLYNHKQSMRGAANNKFTTLLKNHLLTVKELKTAMEEAGKQGSTVENYLITSMKIPKKDVLESLAKYYDVPCVEFDEDHPINKELLEGLRVPFLQKSIWVPIRKDAETLVIAIDDPQNFQKIGEIKNVFRNNPVEFNVALREDILEFIRLFTEGKKKDPAEFDIDDLQQELMDDMEGDDDDEEETQQVDEKSGVVVKLVNKIITDSYKQNVSDIHIEPQPGKENVRVRIRIDGSCREYDARIPYTHRAAIAARIKIMSGLDIAEKRKPQDGKIQFKKYNKHLNIELRVATIPTQGGMEDIVMRILAAGEPIPLASMGFSERNYEEFIKIITQPYGIIFVCGPTGSGKTTTLHSALKYINKVETKIWTAEDPVEITQKGLRQVQVHPKIGFDFAAAMRAFLRADPDVIMVGEMRDKETTHIGIEASLTGHLVFSTLHTNSAAESITRLLDMGMDPFNFADAVLGILAQRLVRTLCKDCKEAYTPTKEEFEDIVRTYGEKDFAKNQPKDVNGEIARYSKELILYRAKQGGCEKCSGTGYRGRMGMHELLVASDEMKKMIQTQERVETMRRQAISEGMRTLKQDGIEKVLGGYTDMIQVKKVCLN